MREMSSIYIVNCVLLCIRNIFTGQERVLNRIRELDYAVK
jgi:hypothetical protein